jgi:UDP-N-acetylmuramate dehydrogenase
VLTTYRVGGAARLYCELEGKADIDRLQEALAALSEPVPTLVLGKGSNMLVSDDGWDGLCVRLGEGYATVDINDSEVVAGGSAAYPVVARRSVAAGLTGMEWAVGIPGSVGGAVRMNAGGHGAETREWLRSATVVRLGAAAEKRELDLVALGLSYRHSTVGPADLVVAARYELGLGSSEEGAARIAEIVRWRRENQPGGQNAGSVFTNPPGDSAGRLIDECGLKGYRIGTAAVSEKHANFIQSDPAGRAEDVRRLIDHIRRLVDSRSGVELEVELRMVGWDPSLGESDPSCS